MRKHKHLSVKAQIRRQSKLALYRLSQLEERRSNKLKYVFLFHSHQIRRLYNAFPITWHYSDKPDEVHTLKPFNIFDYKQY